MYSAEESMGLSLITPYQRGKTSYKEMRINEKNNVQKINFSHVNSADDYVVLGMGAR
jgi:hypothetical protein